MEEPKHLGMIESTWIGDKHQAVCLCGWKGTVDTSSQHANQELENHYAQAGAA